MSPSKALCVTVILCTTFISQYVIHAYTHCKYLHNYFLGKETCVVRTICLQNNCRCAHNTVRQYGCTAAQQQNKLKQLQESDKQYN